MMDRRLGRILGFFAVVATGTASFASCGSSSTAPSNLGDTMGSGGDSGTEDVTTLADSSETHDTGKPEASDAGGECSDAGEAGLSFCSNLCTNLQTDVANCGTCGHNCSTMGASALCVAGGCVCNADAGSSLCGKTSTNPGTCVDTLTDPNNCGACMHVCQVTSGVATCGGGACLATVVASPGGKPWDLYVDSNYVWWTQAASGSAGSVQRKAFASGTSVDVYQNNLPDPRGITLDTNSLYWVDYAGGSVNQEDLTNLNDNAAYSVDWPPPPSDASSPPLYAKPVDIAVDGAAIYWVSNETGNVLSVPKNSGASTVPTVLASGQDHPYAITASGGNVYWVNYGSSPTNGTVMQTTEAPGGPVVTLATGESLPFDIAADANNVYWVDNANPGSVKQVPISGGTIITLAQNEGAPYGIAVDATNVYWTSFDANQVSSIPIGGGSSKTILAPNQLGPASIFATKTNIYWINLTAGTIVEITK